MTASVCFLCDKPDIKPDTWDLEGIRLVWEMFSLCPKHKAFAEEKIAELEKGEPKKFVLKTGQGEYKPSPAVKKSFMDLTTEREPGSDDD